MSDKYAGGIKAGSTSVSGVFTLAATLDSTAVTGKVAADLTCSYLRQGGVRVAITPSDLAAANSAYSSGGVKEIDATNMPGLYRIDFPDAALATGADWVVFTVKEATSFVFYERFALETKGSSENNTIVAAIKAKTDLLVSTTAGRIDAAIIAAGDLAQAAADKVWATTSRALSTSVWDETAASHNTAGSTGNLLNAAGVASDPLLNTVPGTYAAGTAGYVIGNISSDAANIAAIKVKTDQLTFSTPNVVDSSATGGLTAASIAAAVLNTAMTETYAADGVQATLAQMAYMLWAAAAAEKVITGTDMAVKGLDGSTTVMHFTLSSPTNPTSITRAS